MSAWSFRQPMLESMAALTLESPPEELSRVVGCWRRYRTLVHAEVDPVLDDPDTAKKTLEAVWATPEYQNFDRIRAIRAQGTAEYKEYKKAYNKTHYAETTKAQRSTPEVRAKLAEKARDRRAAKKAVAS